MKSVKAFLKKCPIIYALFSLALIIVLLRFVPTIPDCQVSAGIREIIMAAVILIIWGLIQGRKACCPDFTGTKYGFRLMRYMFILYCVFIVISVVNWIIKKIQIPFSTALNLTLAALAVGIVEEFTFRGMLFSGLCHAFGATKKGVLWAAVISGLLFGIIHVLTELLQVHEYTASRLVQMLGKTVQAGMIGFALALIYFKTRSIWAVAALHSLNDALIFFYGADTPQIGNYVLENSEAAKFASGAYLVFILFSLPLVIRTVRELNKETEPLILPLDDEFTPRAPVYVPRKKSKKEA